MDTILIITDTINVYQAVPATADLNNSEAIGVYQTLIEEGESRRDLWFHMFLYVLGALVVLVGLRWVSWTASISKLVIKKTRNEIDEEIRRQISDVTKRIEFQQKALISNLNLTNITLLDDDNKGDLAAHTVKLSLMESVQLKDETKAQKVIHFYKRHKEKISDEQLKRLEKELRRVTKVGLDPDAAKFAKSSKGVEVLPKLVLQEMKIRKTKKNN